MDRLLKVTGKGKISVKPDTIRILITQTAIKKKYEDAVRESADAKAEITDGLAKLGFDKKERGDIEVSNNDLTLTKNDLGTLLSRMSELADLIDMKNTIYDRAEAISKS